MIATETFPLDRETRHRVSFFLLLQEGVAAGGVLVCHFRVVSILIRHHPIIMDECTAGNRDENYPTVASALFTPCLDPRLSLREASRHLRMPLRCTIDPTAGPLKNRRLLLAMAPIINKRVAGMGMETCAAIHCLDTRCPEPQFTKQPRIGVNPTTLREPMVDFRAKGRWDQWDNHHSRHRRHRLLIDRFRLHPAATQLARRPIRWITKDPGTPVEDQRLLLFLLLLQEILRINNTMLIHQRPLVPIRVHREVPNTVPFPVRE
mmetsp:Transcript_4088/g.11746  ORF Transcript_4088/g.11746 Transcript_4088/m.11746 type:complete len:263 (-) Transcript_4088:631-1419(-)